MSTFSERLIGYAPEMETLLSGISSAVFWESFGYPGLPGARPVFGCREFAAPRLEQIGRVRATGLFLPEERLRFMVGSQAARRRSWDYDCGSCTLEFPEGSFMSIGSGVCVCSPALSFVQMARVLSPVQLVHFGMMLCGVYAREPLRADGPASGSCMGLLASNGGGQENALRSRKLHRRLPLVTKDDLHAYAIQAKGIKGARRAISAIPHIVEGSGSPMESAAAMHLCLPYRMGGYAIGHPQMNVDVYADEYAASFTGRRVSDAFRPSGGVRRDRSGRPYYECDMVWRNRSTIVEYHGDPAHFGREGVQRDARKANALSMLGYGYFALTKEALDSPLRLHEFAMGVSKSVGHRFRPTVKDFPERRARLREELRGDYLMRLRMGSS